MTHESRPKNMEILFLPEGEFSGYRIDEGPNYLLAESKNGRLRVTLYVKGEKTPQKMMDSEDTPDSRESALDWIRPSKPEEYDYSGDETGEFPIPDINE